MDRWQLGERLDTSWRHRVGKGKRLREKIRKSDSSQAATDRLLKTRQVKPLATEIDEDEKEATERLLNHTLSWI